MNSNNVYYAKIYRLVEKDGYIFKGTFSRYALVYQKSNEKFYDLFTKRYLNADFDVFSKYGTEIVGVKNLIPFNSIVNQTKENLSKRKIKKLYIEHKNIMQRCKNQN